jgi:hypothetical protein
MTKVVLKILNAGSSTSVLKGRLPFSSVENGEIIVHSQLGQSTPLNDHLVWLWGFLKHERRVLKTAVEGGAKIICECSASKGSIRVLPNGAELLHLLGAELWLEVK